MWTRPNLSSAGFQFDEIVFLAKLVVNGKLA